MITSPSGICLFWGAINWCQYSDAFAIFLYEHQLARDGFKKVDNMYRTELLSTPQQLGSCTQEIYSAPNALR